MTSTLRRILGAMLLAGIVASVTVPLLALDVPPAPTQWVTDRASVLAPADLEALNAKLRDFEQRSGVQFIVYIFPTLDGESLEDFTIRCAEKWKVGQKKYDNGLILFVFIQERKTRIEVGYGLEPTVTDAFSSRVLRNTLPGYFRKSDYAGGLDAAADQLIALIEKKEEPVPASRRGGGAKFTCSDLIFLFVLIMILVAFVGPLARRGGCIGCIPIALSGGSTWRSGRGGFGGGGFGGFSGGGGGFGGFSGGGGGFGGGGASGGW